MTGDNGSTIFSKQAEEDQNTGPDSSFDHPEGPLAVTDAESILREAIVAAGTTVMTIEEAASVGSKFVATENVTEGSQYGRLESDVGGSVISRLAALHQGKIYTDVTKSTWAKALLADELGRLITDATFEIASSLAARLHVHRVRDLSLLCCSPLTLERWKVLRQRRQAVETLWEEEVDDKIKQWILKQHDRLLAGGVSDHIATLETLHTGCQSLPVPLEVALAAYGKLGKNGPCNLSSAMADMLRECCQLDVDNPELFTVAKPTEDQVD